MTAGHCHVTDVPAIDQICTGVFYAPNVMGTNLRRRLPLVALIAACLAAVTAALSGAAQPVSSLQFAQSGHWIANVELGTVFRINGSTKSVDAQARIPGMEPGSQVVQGETSGYVVGRTRIIEFGKSDLEVERTLEPLTGERPVAVETDGGPYLVYREAGRVVRLGVPSEKIPAGGTTLGNPVATPDGTLWLHRLDSNVLCHVPKGDATVSCSPGAPTGHTGALTVVDERAVFVDTTEDQLRPVSAEGIGEPVPTNIDVSPSALVAPADAEGRVAVLEPASGEMHLIDATGLDGGEAAPPVTVDLPEGEYSAPTTSESSVVLLDLTNKQVLTYSPDGTPKETTALPKEATDPRLTRGQDERVYVDGAEGGHVMVVDQDGAVSQVPIVGAEEPEKPRKPVAPPPEPEQKPDEPEQPDNPPQQPQPNPRLQPDDVLAADPVEPRQLLPAEPEPEPAKPEPKPKPEPEPEPEPIPASPPGIPADLAAEAQDDSSVVSWGAAAKNGADVIAYHVSWQPSTGAGSRSLPGSARSTTISGLEAGVSYTITVVAQNSAGRGTPATAEVLIPMPPVTITVTKGEPSPDDDSCTKESCAYMHVEASGLEPGTEYEFQPYSNAPTYGNPGSGQTADENGNVEFDAFDFGEVDYEVWVVIEELGIESNRYKWPAA